MITCIVKMLIINGLNLIFSKRMVVREGMVLYNAVKFPQMGEQRFGMCNARQQHHIPNSLTIKILRSRSDRRRLLVAETGEKQVLMRFQTKLIAPFGLVNRSPIGYFCHHNHVGKTRGSRELAQLSCRHRHVRAKRTVVFGQQDMERGPESQMLVSVIQNNHVCFGILIQKVTNPLATVAIHGQRNVRETQVRHKRLITKHFRISILWICL